MGQLNTDKLFDDNLKKAKSAQEMITYLGLRPHPEGGYYREIYRDQKRTEIYYLLQNAQVEMRSSWHLVYNTDEIWKFLQGTGLTLYIAQGKHNSGEASVHVKKLHSKNRSALCPANSLFMACVTDPNKEAFVLAKCICTPPFLEKNFLLPRLSVLEMLHEVDAEKYDEVFAVAHPNHSSQACKIAYDLFSKIDAIEFEFD